MLDCTVGSSKVQVPDRRVCPLATLQDRLLALMHLRADQHLGQLMLVRRPLEPKECPEFEDPTIASLAHRQEKRLASLGRARGS